MDKFKDKLINFSNIGEMNIRDIWYKDGEEYLNDFSNMEYNYNIPLYQKMIFRFRNNNRSAPLLFSGCDPHNKNRLLLYFGICAEEKCEMIEFFKWLNNEIYHLELNIDKLPNDYIKFYFTLSEEKQKELITKFNKDCIDKFNEYTEIF